MGAEGAPPAALEPPLVPDVEASEDVPEPPEVVVPPEVFDDVVADEVVEPVEICDVSFVRGLNASGPLLHCDRLDRSGMFCLVVQEVACSPLLRNAEPQVFSGKGHQ